MGWGQSTWLSIPCFHLPVSNLGSSSIAERAIGHLTMLYLSSVQSEYAALENLISLSPLALANITTCPPFNLKQNRILIFSSSHISRLYPTARQFAGPSSPLMGLRDCGILPRENLPDMSWSQASWEAWPERKQVTVGEVEWARLTALWHTALSPRHASSIFFFSLFTPHTAILLQKQLIFMLRISNDLLAMCTMSLCI